MNTIHNQLNDIALGEFVHQLMNACGDLIPEYMNNPEDARISNGNVAICIITKDGQVFGKLYGTNMIRTRESYRVAWTKASQVWITGIRTLEFERYYFNNLSSGESYGIEAPDLIGWEGGQPIQLGDGTELYIGFSGFRGVSDIEIVLRGLASLM
ncbi:MAG: hypothetical protein K2Q22_09895 [Cytophagales bacterium]|nr:hypothetical protein [Cytophagales bacterium]